MMKNLFFAALFVSLFVCSCRKEDEVIGSTRTETGSGTTEGEIKGFFLLNEGSMGSNKCTLDYYDYESGVYTKNIYGERNPDINFGLGDVGNDIQIYDNRLFVVVNASNLLEVMDLATAKHIAAVSIPNCRYVAFKDNYAYVSSYAGSIGADLTDRKGIVVKINLDTYDEEARCEVGYQPDELCVVGDKLYVANSGGYNSPEYDSTVSVIDLKTFSVSNEIEVAINLHRLELDEHNILWVSSRGDYGSTPSQTFAIDTTNDTVVKTLDVANSNMTLYDGKLYIYSTEFSYTTFQMEVSFSVIDTATQEVISNSVITDGTQSKIKKPYGLYINADNQEMIITDAGDYITPGKVRCYDSAGVLKWDVTAGDIPAHLAFTRVKLQELTE